MLSGFYTEDELTGGAGIDRLAGGLGADRYHYARGDGADTIVELPDTSGAVVFLRRSK